MNCPTCITHYNRHQLETLLEHYVPEAPWIKVAADLFTIYGKDCLLVVDYSSKYFEVSHVREPVDSHAVVNSMKKIFSRHGIPKELFTDGGPQFVAKEFKKFTKDWDFVHDSSSPHFPQSNGMVECTVQTIKKSLKKVHEANEDVYLALLALNSTPSQDGTSPTYKLFNRQIRTTLPSADVQVKTCNTQKRKIIRHEHARQLPEIPDGSTVRIRTDKDKSWSEMGKVVSKHPNPRSYNILNSRGNVVRRNRRHLIPTKEPFHVTKEYSQSLYSEELQTKYKIKLHHSLNHHHNHNLLHPLDHYQLHNRQQLKHKQLAQVAL